MRRIRQDEVGNCDFIDVLEEAVLHRSRVAVQLRAGEAFLDQMLDVVTEVGVNFAVFRTHARVPVREISFVARPVPRAVS